MSVATPERLHTAANALLHRASANTDGDGDDANARTDADADPRPLSAAQYFARLRTFANPSAWFDKPASCAPPECAARGWVLEACDLLRCTSCDARLAYPACDSLLELEVNARDAVGATIALALHSAHHSTCAWRDATCATIARAFPEEDEANTRSAFARRARDVAERSDGAVPFCVDFAQLRGIDRTEADIVRFRALVGDARAHAAEDGLEDGIGEDAAPLERRAAVDASTALALFGWSAKTIAEDGAGGVMHSTDRARRRRAYCCALCGIQAPEWMFTGVASERRARAEKAEAKKKPKTTAAALRGAAGGAYGMNLASPAVPFAPIVHDDERESASKKWIAATANVASRLRASIGASTATDSNAAPFGAASSSAPHALFGAPRPVTTTTTSAGLENASGDRLASVVVAAMTRRLAAKRKRSTSNAPSLDDNATLAPPSDAVLFDVVHEHREYCPWIVATSKSSVAGWKSTLNTLAGGTSTEDARERRARNFSVVDYAKARDMVRKYINGA